MIRRLLALTLVCAATAIAGSAHADINALTQDHYLFPGQQLQSNCYSRVVFQGDGNLVIYDYRGHAAWASGTANKGGAFVAMQGDGNMVLYNWSGQALWNSGTSRYAGATAYMQGDGNFVVYDTSGRARWASGTSGLVPSGVEISPCNAYGEQMSIFHGWDLPGNDYTHFAMTSHAVDEGCAAACAADSQCKSFTYVPAGVQDTRPVCWLKSVAAGNWSSAPSGFSSGTREVHAINNGNF